MVVQDYRWDQPYKYFNQQHTSFVQKNTAQMILLAASIEKKSFKLAIYIADICESEEAAKVRERELLIVATIANLQEKNHLSQ